MSKKTPFFVPPMTFPKLLPKLMKPVLKGYGFSEASIILDWAKIVGPELAAHCCPDRLAFQKGKQGQATLYLKVEPAFSLMVEYSHPLILDKINSYFGYQAVSRLQIIQTPLPKPTVKAEKPVLSLSEAETKEITHLTEDLPAGDLQDTLKGLGKSLYEKR
jgi:hypothetical protein